jgi:hypothetical protein
MEALRTSETLVNLFQCTWHYSNHLQLISDNYNSSLRLHSITAQKTTVDIFIAVRLSILMPLIDICRQKKIGTLICSSIRRMKKPSVYGNTSVKWNLDLT